MHSQIDLVYWPQNLPTFLPVPWSSCMQCCQIPQVARLKNNAWVPNPDVSTVLLVGSIQSIHPLIAWCGATSFCDGILSKGKFYNCFPHSNSKWGKTMRIQAMPKQGIYLWQFLQFCCWKFSLHLVQLLHRLTRLPFSRARSRCNVFVRGAASILSHLDSQCFAMFL